MFFKQFPNDKTFLVPQQLQKFKIVHSILRPLYPKSVIAGGSCICLSSAAVCQLRAFGSAYLCETRFSIYAANNMQEVLGMIAYCPLIRHEPHIKRSLQQFFVAAGTSLPSCHLATISRYTQTHGLSFDKTRTAQKTTRPTILLLQGISGFLDFIHRPVFEGTRRFGNWICFRPQVKGGRKKTPTQLGPLQRANLNHWKGPNWVGVFFPPFYLRTETDPVSETSCSFKHRTMDIVQKPRNSLCYSPSSQPFRNYSYLLLS
jgi:hypothetical protein